jgi:3-oxoacyl-[acyl-carrier protein] reductase
MELSGKAAVITGAARGIGAAIARYLASNGASVVIADISGEAAAGFVSELETEGFKAIAVQTDISDEKSVSGMMDMTLRKFGKVDILVNNAGIIDSNPIPEMKIEDWDKVMGVNLKGTYLCSKAAIDIIIKNGGGRIVNISSMAGQLGGLKVGPDYSASKAGIIGLTKSFARYGAKYGINVNAVCPGFIETEMTKGRDDPASVPLGRLGMPEDVAKAVFFLASSLSDYITGATIDVNGGLYMR